MIRAHPQWHAVREVIASDRIGELRLISGHSSYYRRDPADVRSRKEWGGGALMDIGCYPIMVSRWMFGEEPAVDQYQLQTERFAESVRGLGRVPVTLESAICNMEVIDALFRSAEQRVTCSLSSSQAPRTV